MSWSSAWGSLLPVYGLALALHAFFPLFSVPVWAIYAITAFKVVSAARQEEDPWEGHPSPRRYLMVFIPLLVVNLVAFILGLAEPSAGGILLFGVTLVPLNVAAAGFCAASAPKPIRRQRGRVRAGVLAAALSAFATPTLAALVLPLDPETSLGLGLVSVVLAVGSWVAFSLADRAARLRAPPIARKVPKQ